MPRRALMLLAVVLLAAGATGGVAHATLSPEARPQAGGWALLGGAQGETAQEHVGALARSGDLLYLGGDFTGLGRRAPGLGAFDLDTGAFAGPVDDLDQHANALLTTTSAIVPAPDGGAYVAGVFQGAGGTDQPRLLRLKADGTLDAAFAPDVDFGVVNSADAISAMALSADGRRLYLAGNFTKVGGLARTKLAAVDAQTGAVTGWQPAVGGGDVQRLAIASTTLYLSGTFTTVGGAARKGLAAVALSNGAPTAFDPQPNALGTVNDVLVAGASVYVSGSFTTLQGTARRLLAEVDPATGAPTAFDARLTGARVTRMAASGSALYLGGASFAVDGGALGSYAAVDRSTAAALRWAPTARKEPAAMTAGGDRVYVAFSGGPNPADGRCGLVSFAAAGAAGAGSTTSWDPHLGVRVQTADVCAGVAMTSIALSGGRLWAGGTFDLANVAQRRGAAAIDLTTDRLTPWAPEVLSATSTKATINAIAVSPGGSTVYLGGTFSSVAGQPRGNLAAVTATGTGTAVAGWGNAVNGAVRALAVDPGGTRLYVAGSFSAIGQFGRAGIGSVSATTGGVSSLWKPQATLDGATATVRDLAVTPDGRVFAAGSFGRIGGADRAGVAEVTPDAADSTGTATAWDAGLPAGTALRSIALGDGRLYAAGAAGAIDAATSVGAFGLATGVRDAAFAAQADNAVYRVSVDRGSTADPGDDVVYLQGTFTQLSGQSRRNVASAAADGSATAWDPRPGPGLSDPAPAGVLPLGDRLVMGGWFAATLNGAASVLGMAWFGPARPPVAGRGPAIAGTPGLGKDLRCDTGRFSGSPGTSTWAWTRDGAPIEGATTSTYTIRADDLGHDVACAQTVTNTAGSATASSDALRVPAPPPEIGTAPAVAGETWAGGVATCTTGLWRNVPTEYAYIWLLDGAELAGETGSAHAVGAAELGHALSCAVTASSAAGSATARSAPVTVAEPPPVNRGAPRVTGAPVVGGTVACDAGTWDGARAFSYIWLRDGAAVDGRTGAAYGVTSRDLGHALECVVTARNDGGERTATSPAVVVTPSAHTETIIDRPVVPEVIGALGGASTRRLDVGTATLAKTGRRVVLRVAVPAAGRLTVRLVKGRTTYGRATATVKRRSTVTLRIALSARTAKAIRRKGAGGLVVTAAATLKPAKGAPQTDRATIRLRLTTSTTIG